MAKFKLRPWEANQILSFVPPDGEFKLMSYRVKKLKSIPIYVKPQLSSDSGTCRISVLVGIRNDPGKSIDSITVQFRLPPCVLSADLSTNHGTVNILADKTCSWSIGRIPKDKAPSMSGTMALEIGLERLKVFPTFQVSFRIMGVALSDLQIDKLDLKNLPSRHGGLQVFRQMILEEAEPNPYSYSIAVRACASIGSHVYGKQIHAAMVKHGFESSIPVMNSILDMYCSCSHLSEADQCFHGMPERDIITWNTLIAGHEKSDPYESLNHYSLMESECITPNCFMFTSIIAAAANMALLSLGEPVHGKILRRGFGNDLAVANALIDMYAKCGSIVNSFKIFKVMCDKNIVSWTSMLIGYGSHGHGEEAVKLFDQMIHSGIRPDRIVFVAVLHACSHAGLVDEGLRYFKSMLSDYNITPDQDIYGCVVDLLGRAGRVKEAYELIESMPFMPDESIWGGISRSL